MVKDRSQPLLALVHLVKLIFYPCTFSRELRFSYISHEGLCAWRNTSVNLIMGRELFYGWLTKHFVHHYNNGSPIWVSSITAFIQAPFKAEKKPTIKWLCDVGRVRGAGSIEEYCCHCKILKSLSQCVIYDHQQEDTRNSQ